MFTLTSIAGLMVLLGLVVLFHEAGHFLVAKLSGMRVDEFAMGFGPKLVSYKRGETVYAINLVPLGGYVKIAGMEPGEEEVERGFYTKSKRARAAVLTAGPLMNFVLALVVFYFYGALFGIPTGATCEIAKVLPGTPAYSAGFQPGDVVVKVEGKPATSVDKVIEIVRNRPDQPTHIEVERAGRVLTLTVTPKGELEKTLDQSDPEHAKLVEKRIGKIGIVFRTKVERVGALKAIWFGLEQTIKITFGLVDYLVKAALGKLPFALGGPVMIANQLGQDLEIGLQPYLFDLGLISINIGLFNLLPVPPLDGSRLLFLLLEALLGKPIPRNKEALVHLVGFVLLMLLMVWIIVQDVIALVQGVSPG